MSNEDKDATIAQLRAKVEKLTQENVFLRVKSNADECIYGFGNKETGCSLGYPGCSCMDDLLAMQSWCPEDEDKASVRLGRRLNEAEARADKAEAALAKVREHVADITNIICKSHTINRGGKYIMLEPAKFEEWCASLTEGDGE